MKNLTKIIILFFILIISTQIISATLDDGVIAYYNLSSAKDYISGNILGISGASYVGAKVGNGLYFDGTNDFAVTNMSSSSGVNITLCFWMASNNSAAYKTSFTLGANNASGGFRMQMRADNGNKWTYLTMPSNAFINGNIPYNSNTLFHTCLLSNGTYKWTYLNGTFSHEIGTSETAYADKTFLGLGTAWGDIISGEYFGGIIDEFIIYNKVLNATEILAIYTNNTNGLTYPFVAAPIILPSYNVTNIQYPNDINSSTLNIRINTTITNFTTYNITNDSTTNLYLKVYTSLNNGCSIYEQKVCVLNNATYQNFTMTKVNNTYFTRNIFDNNLLPAYYPFNYDFINNNVGANYSFYNNIKFNVYNFSTNTQFMYLQLEMDARNLSTTTANINVYYCNSSYVSGSPSLSGNCEPISVFSPQTWEHAHNNSKHNVIRFQINNVTKTQVSYFIFQGLGLNIADSWNFRYVLNSSYDNTSFNIGTFNTWTATPNIFDVHLHNYLPNDYIAYYTIFNDGINNFNTSSTTYDFFNITQSAPTNPFILTPPCYTSYTIGGNELLNITWSRSSDINNDSILYNLTLNNPLNIKSSVYYGTETNMTYPVNSLSANTYNPYFSTCDTFNNCNNILLNCNIIICANSYTKINNPCLSDTRLVTYKDDNNCNAEYNIPSDNSTYEFCVSPADRVELNINNELLILLITLFIIISSFIVSVRSEGKFKSLIGISGLFLMILSVELFALLLDNTMNEIYYYIIYTLSGVFMISGIILFIIGVLKFISTEK